MDYEIIVSPRAQLEIEEAVEFYVKDSRSAAKNFLIELDAAYKFLSHSPYFVVCYKNVRMLNLKGFPYSLFYVIDETQKRIRILACFHSKRNPINRP